MPRIKVLIVDDELGMIDYIADVVEDMGCDIKAINDSVQFSSVFSPEIDILILDIFMPGIDGIELLSLIPNVNPHVAVIFISGKDIGILHASEKLALAKGISVLGVLEKPFSPDQLEEMIKKYVRTTPCHTSSM
jgi:CheY-like chemotaxis protein